MKWLLIVCILSGCSKPVVPPPAALSLPPSPVASDVVPPAPMTAKPVVAVTKAYQAARAKELPAVLAPNVTPDYVANIHAKEVAARHAVRILEGQGTARTPEALATARAAVQDLEDAVTAPNAIAP